MSEAISIEIMRKLRRIKKWMKTMTQQLQALTDEVTGLKTVATSASALLAGLAAKIESMKDDPAALQQLANDLRSTKEELAAAVAANTPAE